MSPLEFTLIVALIAVSAGLLGSLAGVGGGVIIVPALTLLLGVEIRHAIAASIVAVVATSSAAASTYVRSGLANIRLGIFLESATATGAIVGATLAGWIPGKFLFLCFGAVLAFNAWQMSRKPRVQPCSSSVDSLADRLQLHATYWDPAIDREESYRVKRTKAGLGVSGLAGVVSGLLGVGGGLFKVPVMHLAMGVPIKAATATSNFMIGITAATGASIFLLRGDVQPFIAAPVSVGVILGSKWGARLLGRLKQERVRAVFIGVMVVAATQMLWKGWTS